MNDRFSFGKKFVLIASMLMLQSVINAQVMWSLRGGIMPVTVHEDMDYDEDATVNKIDWMAEFGLEIPLSQSWNIETGLRYRMKSYVPYQDEHCEETRWTEDRKELYVVSEWDKRHYRTYLNASLIELPIRATYKVHLNDYFSLHLGCGPYASINLAGKPFVPTTYGDGTFKSSALSVGIEPSAALYYKNLSVGVIYNNPVFFQRHKEMDSNRFMITLGFRFGNKVWKSIGNAMVKAADSGALDIMANTANQLAENIGEYNRAKQELIENSYSTQDNKTSKAKSSSSSSKSKNSISDQQNYNSAKKAYKVLDDMVVKWRFGGRSYTEQERKDAGRQMRDLRLKWVNKGYKDWPHENEEWCLQ